MPTFRIFYTVGTLMDAAKKGNLDQVKKCIHKGMDAEAKVEYGFTALHYAAGQYGHLEVVQYLMEECYVKEPRTNDGGTALHFASAWGRLEIVQYLIQTCHVDREAKDKNGRTALHYASDSGELKIVQYLIETCQVDKEAKNKSGSTALHIASMKGRLELVQYLIETCHADTKATDTGWTTLHYASYNGHLVVVKYLIEVCHIDTEAKTDSGRTALHFACDHSYGRLNVVQYLTESCHVDKEAKDRNGRTALYLASSWGNLNVVQYLVEICRVDKEARTNDGQTAYDIARANHKGSVVKYLKKRQAASTTIKVNIIESAKDNIVADQKPKQSTSTPTNSKTAQQLHLEKDFLNAAEKGLFDTVKKCIKNGVDKEAKDEHGRAALHFASFYGHLNVVRFLIETCHVEKEAKTNNGETSLNNASGNGQLEIVQYLIEVCHVDKEAKDIHGWTALHRASSNGQLKVVQYLIETCHVDTEARAGTGWTALHWASYNGNLEIVQYLMELSNVDKEVKTNKGFTALHCASMHHGHLNVVQYLIETCHVDTDAKDGYGETAFDMARKNTQSRVAQYMETARDSSTTMKDSSDILIPNSDSKKESSYAYELDENWMSNLQDENQQLIDKLNELDSSVHFRDERRDIIDLIIVEKCNTIEDQAEQSAILASPLHRDFYLLLQRKLKCMIKACETLSTGMVGDGGGDLRSFTARTIREKGCNVLQETKLGYFIGNATQWAQQNLAVIPFIDTFGSIFQLIVTLKDERDRYLGLARVADFATMVCLQQYGTTSLDSAVEKLARLIVRARCGSPSCKFIEEMDEFGKYKQLMINLLADAGDTPAKEQASKAADCAFAHIMKPGSGSILFDALYGDTFDVNLHEALAASILGISLEDLRELESFTIPSCTPSKTGTDDGSRLGSRKTSNVGFNATSLPADSFAISDLVAEQEAKTQKQDVMIQKLANQVAHLEKKAKLRTNYDAGGGLIYANPAEQFKDEITSLQTENVVLDQRQCDQATIIDHLMSRIADLERQQLSRPFIETRNGPFQNA